VTLLRDEIATEVRPWRAGATVFGLFGVVALIIASVGLYSVVIFTVSQRAYALAVRIALVATSRGILLDVAGRSLGAVATGLGIGALLAFAVHRWVGPMLFQMAPGDPRVILGVAGLLFGVALTDSLVPTTCVIRSDTVRVLKS
jgi:ABC-type antimicrobial peptide transport system permease subunit